MDGNAIFCEYMEQMKLGSYDIGLTVWDAPWLTVMKGIDQPVFNTTENIIRIPMEDELMATIGNMIHEI